MTEIRIDPLTGQRTIVAAVRVHRPGGELSTAPDFAPAAAPAGEIRSPRATST